MRGEKNRVNLAHISSVSRIIMFISGHVEGIAFQGPAAHLPHMASVGEESRRNLVITCCN